MNDPFLSTKDDLAAELGTTRMAKIHVRTQQMGRKWVTTIEGLDDDLDLKRIARAMKGDFHCSAAVVEDEPTKQEIIKLSGDQKALIRGWLVAAEILTDAEATERLVIH
jgi:translation initiation factor 1